MLYLQVEQMMGKDLQIHPTNPPTTSTGGYDWKRRAAAASMAAGFNNGAPGTNLIYNYRFQREHLSF